jgi:restriction endonuclease S subunit
VRKLEEIAELEYGTGEPAKEDGGYRYIRITDIGEDGRLNGVEKKYIDATPESAKYLLNKSDVLVARTGATYGKTLVFEEDEPSAFAGFLIRINFNPLEVLSKYYWCFAQTERYWNQARSLVTGGGQPQFNANAIKQIQVPIPPMSEQRRIVEEVIKEEEVVNHNRFIMAIFEDKIKDKISEVWGE